MRIVPQRWLRIVVIALLAVVSVPTRAASDGEQRQQLLQLKAAWLAMESARADRDRMRRLAEAGLCSAAEMERAQSGYAAKQVAYQQEFVRLFAASPRISVVRCVKSTEADARYVNVTLKNTSAPALDYRSVGVTDDGVPLPDAARLSDVDAIEVSLSDEAGTVISEPYASVVRSLSPNEVATVRFLLLKDVDSVHVALRYAARTETTAVMLEKDKSANAVMLRSQEFSQEADLGASASFDLHLERYSGYDGVLALRVFGLPDDVGAEFVDQATGARLTQIRFDDGAGSKALRLRVYLPEVSGGSIALDRPLAFLVAAVTDGQAERLPRGRRSSAAELEAAQVRYVRLELVPRGVGRLEVIAPQLFAETARGGEVHLSLKVKNGGTRRIDNVRLGADAPADWRVEFDPALIKTIEPGREESVALTLQPSSQVEVGDYAVRLSTEAYAANRRLESIDQTARIHVASHTSIVGIFLLVGVLLAGVGALVFWAARLARR